MKNETYVSQMAPVVAPLNFANDAPSLLEQMALRLNASTMSRLAALAFIKLAAISELPVEQQEALIGELSFGRVSDWASTSEDRQVLAIVASALLTAAKRCMRATASEKVSHAMQLLSDDYAADW